MNIQCMNCEYGNRCTNCMYKGERRKRDLEREQKERLGSKNQKKTADMRLYKRQKKGLKRQSGLAFYHMQCCIETKKGKQIRTGENSKESGYGLKLFLLGFRHIGTRGNRD